MLAVYDTTIMSEKAHNAATASRPDVDVGAADKDDGLNRDINTIVVTAHQALCARPTATRSPLPPLELPPSPAALSTVDW